MKLRARALGLAVGTVWGLGVFVATLWAVLMGGGNTLRLLAAYYYGYSVSFGGAIIGMIWGFVDGFIVGLAVAWLYNKFHSAIYKTDYTDVQPSAPVPTR